MGIDQGIGFGFRTEFDTLAEFGAIDPELGFFFGQCDVAGVANDAVEGGNVFAEIHAGNRGHGVAETSSLKWLRVIKLPSM